MRDSMIVIDPETMGGTPVFRGTRVPIQTFVDHMGSEDDIRDFFDGFPTVSREQVIDLLDEVKERLLVAT
uniref:Uncharacterized conserved protein, DUF433 family n=1 Tax=Candidatus Kentrum sp. FM TaxID=2126340 RepID=A0A450WNW0_9GAMM|nr:MAG: Uncharacterized conserved protein, DUF433 family [Candidatus Kentron sp. FM]VFJ72400.1 MAG: Uncharacterized conserved protein, DUF433 family [Candidatus Kentron sp. FM]VFK18710.1 MAG: Uncharacterized conserved protein, DUF433 family [Candidatus Kentron sp. FM]